MVTQVVHIPTLNYMSHLSQVTYLCDVSEEALEHSKLKVAGASKPKITLSCEELCTASEMDLVIIASNHPLHASQAELALKAKKSVFIEKPISLILQDADRIVAADKAASGDKVSIGYMRRYAGAFLDAVKEVGSIEQIRYARIRDIIAVNDYREEDTKALHTKTREDMEQALQTELEVAITEKTEMMWEFLSILGSHDLSAMRELMGMPESVIGFSPLATIGSLFWSVMFQYPGLVVAYESGVDQVSRFAASIELFGDAKSVKVCIDAPFVKGLPTMMVIKESLPDESYRVSTTRKTYEDPFTLELQEVYQWAIGGKSPKTSPADARQDLKILGVLMKAGTA